MKTAPVGLFGSQCLSMDSYRDIIRCSTPPDQAEQGQRLCGHRWKEGNANGWESLERFSIPTVPPQVNLTGFWAQGKRQRETGEAPGKFK